LEENPTGTRGDYACEVAEITYEIMDEFLRDLPANLRPEPGIFNHLLKTQAGC
jgi:hypothetical protein